ncbi:MAG: hypothetical protein PHV51_04680 [Methanosarcinaceae archaeon]|nr:hypothetical protein [Methanosarcinaceae archaeon]MDD4497433.1 hypothetical protein [Methanosarcinaceae archaeon]
MDLQKLCILIILTAMVFINPAIASNPIIDIDYNIDDIELEQFSFTNPDTTSINIDHTGILNRDGTGDDDTSNSYIPDYINQLKNAPEYVSVDDYYKDSNSFDNYDDYNDSKYIEDFENSSYSSDYNESKYFDDFENYNDSKYFGNSNDSKTEPINSDTQKLPGFTFGITFLSTMVIFKLKQN